MINNKQKYLNTWFSHIQELSKVADVFLYSKDFVKYEEVKSLIEKMEELIIEAADIEFLL